MERGAKPEIAASKASLSPSAMLVTLALLSAFSWTIAPALTHLAPPLDVVEGYMWGREWPLLTYKHPAMPAWVIEASRIATFGSIGWPVYLASQLFGLATIALTYALARDVVGDHRALLATLPLLLFEHLSWRSPEFNHTVAQLPFWVAVVLFTWRAIERGTWTAWLALALAMVGGVYAKFSHGLIVVIAAAWLLYDARSRRQLATLKPWIAGLLAVALMTPIVVWFARNGLQPLEYAKSRSAEPSASPIAFLARAGLTALPMLLVIAAAHISGNRESREARRSNGLFTLPFIAWMTLGPLVLSMIAAGLSGSGLRTSWAAPMLTLLPLLLVVAIPQLLMPQNLRPVAAVLGVAILAIAVGYGARLFLGRVGNDGPTRSNWPEKAISEAAAAAWSKESGKPLRIIAGDTWPAGLVGIRHPDRPSILTAGDLTLSPWITPDRLSREGALAVFEPKRAIPDKLKTLIGDRQPRPLEFYGPGRSNGAQLSYVIIPPSP